MPSGKSFPLGMQLCHKIILLGRKIFVDFYLPGRKKRPQKIPHGGEEPDEPTAFSVHD